MLLAGIYKEVKMLSVLWKREQCNKHWHGELVYRDVIQASKAREGEKSGWLSTLKKKKAEGVLRHLDGIAKGIIGSVMKAGEHAKQNVISVAVCNCFSKQFSPPALKTGTKYYNQTPKRNVHITLHLIVIVLFLAMC